MRSNEEGAGRASEMKLKFDLLSLSRNVVGFLGW